MHVERFLVYALVGLCLHPIFKRREPNVILFLVLVFSSAIATYSHLVYSGKHRWLTALGLTLCAIGSSLGALSCSVVVYRLSPWHPLAHYPGPALAKISKWWVAYWVAKGERHLVLQRLHARYGPWLRIGPNEISVNIPGALRPVYGTMFRAPFYQTARQDADGLVTTIERAEHASSVVAWNKAFSGDSLHNFRGMAEIRTNQLLDILHAQSTDGQIIDLSHWISLWAMDNMGDMSFSGGFETMAAGKDVEGWMKMFNVGSIFVGIAGQAPWIGGLIAFLPQLGPVLTFQKFVREKVASTRAKSLAPKQDILGIIQDESSGGPALSPEEAAADAGLMLVAGSETISQGLTALFRHIIGDPTVQTRLRAEIGAAFDEGEYVDPVRLTTQLPFLDACVQETLRMVPPLAIGPPRYSDGDGGQILDRWIPGGTTIACPMYTLHHDPQNFGRPEEFIPERWLAPSEVTPHVQEAFLPFSYGPGACVGKPVALYNMKLFAVRVLQRFQLSFPEGFDVGGFDASYKEHNLWIHDPLLVKAAVI
ncbi:cytochrome P450 [Lyophyllum atratum]|nr:cytochrome P450 [Lyophyllum atratum]